MMKRDWQSPGSGPPSNHHDLWVVWAIFIIFVLAWASVRCTSRPSAPEPEWDPPMFALSANKKGECVILGAEDVFGDPIKCVDAGNEFVAVRARDFLAGKKKMYRCESWR